MKFIIYVIHKELIKKEDYELNTNEIKLKFIVILCVQFFVDQANFSSLLFGFIDREYLMNTTLKGGSNQEGGTNRGADKEFSQ